jgi:diguanylate cyclase (GGDEF)-like protein
MRLVSQSRLALAVCALGGAALLAVAGIGLARFNTQQAEIAELGELESRVDRFSAVSDRLLIYPPSPERWARYRDNARFLQQRLRERSDHTAIASSAAEHVETIFETVSAAVGPSGEGESQASAPVLDWRRSGDRIEATRAVLDRVAAQGLELDADMTELFDRRRAAVAASLLWILVGLAGSAVLFAVVAVLALGAIHQRVVRPIEALRATVERIRRGDTQARLRWGRVDELGQLAVAFDELLDEEEQAQDALRESRDHLAHLSSTRAALIDSLPAHVAVLASNGTIEAVNERWRHYSAHQGTLDPELGVGSNYLAVYAQATGPYSEEAHRAKEGIDEVLSGRRKHFSLEYPCHSEDHQQWFRLEANRLDTVPSYEAAPRAVVMHVDITERKLAEQELERLAYEDALTRLLTRKGLIRHLSERLAHGDVDAHACLIALDIVGLRDINDAYGYDGGDHMLIELGRRMAAQLGSGGLVARIGGDELALLLPAPADCDTAAARSRLAEAFDAPIALNGANVEIRARFGFVELGETHHSAEELLREAELALFRNRDERSTDPWTGYTNALDQSTQLRIETTRDLQRALEQHEFGLHFQPQVDLATGRLLAGEALIRWHHPECGRQSPATFIPVAEQSQLIVPIGEWAIREACRCIHAWRAAGLDVVPVAVNVSLIQLAVGNFHEVVRDALATYDLPGWALSLEITESVFERASQALRDHLQAIHDLGVRLSLDDFGTGYSSLLYLKQYPFDELKIDQGFVRAVRGDAYSRHVVQLVIGLGQSLGVDLIAEGIEDDPVRQALLALDCRRGQGYYFSMPLEAEEFRWLLEAGAPLPRAPAAHGASNGGSEADPATRTQRRS